MKGREEDVRLAVLLALMLFVIALAVAMAYLLGRWLAG